MTTTEKQATKDPESIEATWRLFEVSAKDLILEEPRGEYQKMCRRLAQAFPEDIPAFLEHGKRIINSRDTPKLEALADQLMDIHEKLGEIAEKDGIKYSPSGKEEEEDFSDPGQGPMTIEEFESRILNIIGPLAGKLSFQALHRCISIEMQQAEGK